MNRIDVKFANEEIQKIEYRLNGLADSKTAIRTMLNNTAKQALNLLAKQSKGVYAFRGNIRQYAKVRKATGEQQEASIEFKSKVNEPRDFRVNPAQTEANISKTRYTSKGKRAGRTVKMKVLNEGDMKPLIGETGKAFIVKFRSGHVAVVSREANKKMKSNPKKAALRKMLTPSVPTMVGNEKVYGAAADEIGQIMHRETEKVIAKLLNR